SSDVCSSDLDPFGVAESVAGGGLDADLGVVAIGHGDGGHAQGVEDGSRTQAFGPCARPTVDEDRPRLMRFGMVAGKQPGGQGAGVGADLDRLAIHSGGQGVGEDDSGPASAPGTTDVAAG